MKKNLLAVSALALAVMSGSALAAPNGGDIQFIGTVTDTTCDIVPEANGAVNSVVQLGNVATSTTAAGSGSDQGAVVNFALKPKAGSTCNPANMTNAAFAFSGPLEVTGLAPQSGSATDAMVKLRAVNATGGAHDINKTTSVSEVTLTDLNDPAKGAQFSAQLIGGAQAGDYRSAVAYVVSYN
ncbi:fimbrial protein PefA [Salmonella enterica]|uniref:Fimbrial protein PefA n=2 Tax=Salmonella enterica I TaxID=59201 RepID=A0A5H6XXI8_SALET|nr:hypothetical protein [Salmonella enterica]EAA7288983.1 fimbrial protein PefA [Salmonella enterica subsp. enterica]EBQ5851706.1 fimbrial protein PefA [Salmonella enterica subsp. enterica serovar Virchow]ECK9479039.1 fimbrial protein PefA [Salmonella enterica subsp. enterica serovar Heidelberg str. CFSAN000578]EDA9102961.1 fimbrial protein PefA [Salmonella enterica subsp. enterica serovar Augustenborg]EED4175481.1 fimbrial protein PefA [Salmonella enterica subsp. enterica serovar Rubislaw]HE